MSIAALNWAFTLKLPNAGMKALLLALANFSNEDGVAYPSQKTLSELACMAERTVRDSLAKLEELGVISRVPRTRANGSYTTDLFKLNLGLSEVGEVSDRDEKNQRQNSPAAESADGRKQHSQRQITTNPAAESAGPEPSLNTTITKNNQPASEQAREALVGREVPVELADQWLELRIRKAQPMPDEAMLDTLQAEAWLVGLRLEQALSVCVSQGWAWFKARWYQDLPNEKKRSGAHGPPKNQLAEKDWRSSPAGVLKRGQELGIEPRIGESEQEYRDRVGRADWDARRMKAAEELSQFKRNANAGELEAA